MKYFSLKKIIKKLFGYSNFKKNYIKKVIQSFFVRGDLNRLAIIWGTDKWGQHWYTQHYNKHFKSIKSNKINFLEIGVGGYERPNKGGNSLRAWKYYFKKANIYAIDIFDKSLLQEKRIKIFKGSQVDDIFLDNVCKEIGVIDIIVDDGSHINEHIIFTFKLLFPKLNDGGIYVVEDLQTSYWSDYGGDSINIDNPKSAINYFRSLVHCLNHQELNIPNNYSYSYFDNYISEIHFYHNMVFIYKSKNNEKSINRSFLTN